MSPHARGGGSDRRALDALRRRLAEAERAAKKRERPMKTSAASRLSEVPTDEPLEHPLDEPMDVAGEGWLVGRGPVRDPGSAGKAPGGLASRMPRGQAGASWWSFRFLGSLESMMAGGRMARGRAYAKKGRVVALAISPGVIGAKVQGSREEPYAVRLTMPVVPADEWDRIVAALATRAGYAAHMLAGELPHEVEEVFASEGASLLPAPHARLVTECDCAGFENPCAHVAAVCYLVAVEFDLDPFSLLAWRGRGRAEVLDGLRAQRRGLGECPETPEPSPSTAAPDVPGAAGGWDAAAAGAPRSDPVARDPVARDPVGGFWVAGPELAHVRVRPEESAVPAAALRLARRGSILVRGGDLADVLVPAYRAIVAAGAARSRR